jgi:hypothetical protein
VRFSELVGSIRRDEANDRLHRIGTIAKDQSFQDGGPHSQHQSANQFINERLRRFNACEIQHDFLTGLDCLFDLPADWNSEVANTDQAAASQRL